MPRKKKMKFGPYTITRVLSVTDGDTFRCDIDKMSAICGRDMPIRIRNIDCPESRCDRLWEKRLAARAQLSLKTILEVADVITISNVTRGKYFRLLADVFADGVNVGSEMIRAGHARKYTGGTREPWKLDPMPKKEV